MIEYDTNFDLSGERFKVTYRIFEPPERARDVAQLICVEQTIEFPIELTGERIKKSVVGQIEDLSQEASSTIVTISYPVEVVGQELTQFLNVILGNCSLFPNVKIMDLQLSNTLRRIFAGPRYGIDGLRKLLEVYDRPLLATAIKPLSLSADQLADMAYKLALGGIDIIKDDHGLADQSFAKFEERVVKVTRAVKRANREVGSRTIYAPNVTGSESVVLKRASLVKELDSGAILIAPALAGFSTTITLSQQVPLPILSHPAFLGGYISIVDHRVLFGKIQRILGADVCIFPNYGGRFTFSKSECAEIHRGLKEPFEPLKAAFPAPAGGMNIEKIEEMIEFYGKDVVLLIGGALHKIGPNLIENVKIFKEKTLEASRKLS
jgi:ribulose-bisphosphate carboxylase large chain